MLAGYEDTRMDADITYEEEDALLSEDRDSIQNAQRQERKRDTTNKPKSRKRPSEQKTKEPTGSEKTSNDRGKKREEPPKSAETNGSYDRKRSRHEEELNSIQKKI